jgi:hypothetical protein
MLLGFRTAMVAAVITLAAPAAASATVWTVDPSRDKSGACEANSCPTIQKAVDAAAGGDVVNLLEGTYPESVDIPKPLTLNGPGPGEAKVTGSGTGDVLTVSASLRITGITVDVPANAGSAVRVTAGSLVLERSVAQRVNASDKNEPVIDAAGGVVEVLDSFVVQGAGTGTAALATTAAARVTVADSFLISSTGPGVALAESDTRLLRSSIVSVAEGGDGVRLAAPNTGSAKRLVMDSSVLIAGTGAAGLRVTTTGNAAGDVTVAGRHVTISGPKGAVLDASAAGGPILPAAKSSGNIAATFTSSIVHGPSEAKRHVPAAIPTTTGNTVRLTFSHSDAPPAGGDGTIDMGNASNTPDAQLFAPKSLKLRADAPVIDKGAAPADDESATDIDDEPRVGGPASDIGADEFLNKPPRAVFGVTDKNPAQGQIVGFVSGSTDPEQDAGGGIVEYVWDFGDGTREVTRAGGVAHAYSRLGTYNVTLQVRDRQGGVSEVSAPQAVTVRDATPPRLSLVVPTPSQVLKLVKRKLPLTVLGSWEDVSGVRSIQIAVQVVKRDKVKKPAARKRTKKKKAKRSATTCEFYSGRLLARKRCDRPIWLPAVINGKGFALQTRKGLRLPAGVYEIRVRATDAVGNATVGFSAAEKTLVRFRVR